MLLSVFTRIREIAILRVCGFSPAQVAALIFGEASVIALLGLLVGGAIGFGALAILERVPQFHGYLQAAVSPALLVGIAMFAASLAWLHAAWKHEPTPT